MALGIALRDEGLLKLVLKWVAVVLFFMLFFLFIFIDGEGLKDKKVFVSIIKLLLYIKHLLYGHVSVQDNYLSVPV